MRLHWCIGIWLSSRACWLWQQHKKAAIYLALRHLVATCEWIKYHNQEFIDGHFDGYCFLAAHSLIPVLRFGSDARQQTHFCYLAFQSRHYRLFSLFTEQFAIRSAAIASDKLVAVIVCLYFRLSSPQCLFLAIEFLTLAQHWRRMSLLACPLKSVVRCVQIRHVPTLRMWQFSFAQRIAVVIRLNHRRKIAFETWNWQCK